MAAKDMYVREQLAEAAAQTPDEPKDDTRVSKGGKGGKQKSKNVSLEKSGQSLADKKKDKGCC